MYKLVVVDDEAAIRQGMCKYINWHDMGFTVAADFEDGKETIDYIQKHPVDVILTDIEMAEVSGLELAKYVYEHQKDIRIVIISGYREFEYARKAVEYNVEHYLLKPIRMNEVQEVFAKIKSEFDRQKEDEDKSLSSRRNFEEQLPELQEQFFISLLVGGIRSRESITRKKELLNFDFAMDTPCAILDVRLKMDEEGNLGYYTQQDNRHNLINNIFQGEDGGLGKLPLPSVSGKVGKLPLPSVSGKVRYYPAYMSSDILKVIAIAGEAMAPEQFKELLDIRVTDKVAAVHKLLRLDMEIMVEKQFRDIMELAEHKYTLRIHVRDEAGHVPEQAVSLVPEDYARLMQKYRLLIEVIGDGDFEALDNLTDNIFFEFRKLPLGQVKQLIVDMFAMLSNKYMKMGSDLWQDMNEIVNYQEILDIDNKGELKSVCKARLQAIIEIPARKHNDVSRSVVEQAIDFMKTHYDEDISLDSMAERYFLNPTYFSRLFKQYTGNTFTDYLIELRMERAKDLIEAGKYKMYEVSRMVGYRSEKYFYRVFKQYTGRSPLEYYRSIKEPL